MKLKALRVSEVNQYIKRLLVSDPILYNLRVEGEISNFKHHYNGHMYFTLKDENSKLRCVMFNGNNSSLDFIPKDGMKVIISGYISVYERDGSYQLYAKSIKKQGIGDLYVAFEELKNKLEKEGLFDPKHKKRIPYIPKKIGVVTSSTGAAVRDIITVIKRRFPVVEIIIYSAHVQGERAAQEIAQGLKYFDSRGDIDLVITGRGGGSIEELWAFNKEEVARAIFDMKAPVISAVGHETDFTIADFVADLRAPTPSSAGELATPILDELKSNLEDNLLKLEISIRNLIKNKKNELDICVEKLKNTSPANRINEYEGKVDTLYRDLVRSIDLKLKDSINKLENTAGKLDALSPLSILNRGYSISKSIDGKVIRSVNDLAIDDTVEILLKDGLITSKVVKLDKRDKEERGI